MMATLGDDNFVIIFYYISAVVAGTCTPQLKPLQMKHVWLSRLPSHLYCALLLVLLNFLLSICLDVGFFYLNKFSNIFGFTPCGGFFLFYTPINITWRIEAGELHPGLPFFHQSRIWSTPPLEPDPCPLDFRVCLFDSRPLACGSTP